MHVFLSRTLCFVYSKRISEAGNYDRVVIQEILKEIAQTQQVDLNAKQRFKSAFAEIGNIYVLVLIPFKLLS